MGKKSKKKKDKVTKKLKEKKENKIEREKSEKKAEKKAKKKRKAKKRIEEKDKKQLRNIVLRKNVKSNNKEIKNIPSPILNIEKSKNFNVTIARDKIRSFTCEKLLANFVKGDLRITINKAVTIRKRQINKVVMSGPK